jgi:hypothetical protein
VPQARSSGSKSASTSGRSQTKRASASKSAGAKRTTRKTASAKSSASKPRATRASATKKSAGAGTTSARSTNGRANSAADPRLDAVAARVRKLNERIIEESKSAGEATLTAYEKALKAIAASLERGPGKSDVEWVSSLATTQAKWIRDITTAWTAAARGVLK